MRKSLWISMATLMLLGMLVLMGQRVAAQSAAPTATPQVQVQGGGSQSVNPLAPDTITSLPMSNPFCSQPDPTVNSCLINVRYWQANDNGTAPVLGYVLFSIDGKLRFRSNTFFENVVSYSYDMIPGGIKVTCGLPNEGGFGTLYGRAYTVDVRAYDVTNNWVLDDQISVKCPAFNP